MLLCRNYCLTNMLVKQMVRSHTHVELPSIYQDHRMEQIMRLRDSKWTFIALLIVLNAFLIFAS